MKNLIKPSKQDIRPAGDMFGITCFSILAAIFSVFITIIGFVVAGIPSTADIVDTTLVSVPLVVFLLTFIVARFGHLPRKIKANVVYNRHMKEYTVELNKRNTHNFITICRGRSHD